MNHVPVTQALLDDRETEVNGYLAFLAVALEREATLSAKNGELAMELSLSLTHTLKANTLLLLYSAMEATLVQLLDEMHEAIESQCHSADALNAALLSLVMDTFKKAKGKQEAMDAPLHRSLFRAWISDWKARVKSKDKRVGGISGSVDGMVFYSQLKRFGVVSTKNDKPPKHLTHHALQRIKVERNTLAHGESSFTDKGRDLELTSLKKDAQDVFLTLRAIAKEVNTYLDEKRYLAEPGARQPEAPGRQA